MRAVGRRYDTVSFLSDYGLDDEFVGVVKSVIRDLARHVTVIDLTHDITPHDVRGRLARPRPGDPVRARGRRARRRRPRRRHRAAGRGGRGRRRRGRARRPRQRAAGAGGGDGRRRRAGRRAHQRRRTSCDAPGATFAGRDVFAPGRRPPLQRRRPRRARRAGRPGRRCCPGMVPLARPEDGGARRRGAVGRPLRQRPAQRRPRRPRPAGATACASGCGEASVAPPSPRPYGDARRRGDRPGGRLLRAAGRGARPPLGGRRAGPRPGRRRAARAPLDDEGDGRPTGRPRPMATAARAPAAHAGSLPRSVRPATTAHALGLLRFAPVRWRRRDRSSPTRASTRTRASPIRADAPGHDARPGPPARRIVMPSSAASLCEPGRDHRAPSGRAGRPLIASGDRVTYGELRQRVAAAPGRTRRPAASGRATGSRSSAPTASTSSWPTSPCSGSAPSWCRSTRRARPRRAATRRAAPARCGVHRGAVHVGRSTIDELLGTRPRRRCPSPTSTPTTSPC